MKTAPRFPTDSAALQILFTGDYLSDYNRTAIIKSGLKKMGHEIIELPFKKKTRSLRKAILTNSKKCDFIFMPPFTHKEVGYVKKMVGNKKIVFDPLISRYMTKVHDYKLVSKYSFSALRNYYRDKCALDAADFIVTDTQAHLEYFHKKFKVKKEKMGVLYIGNDFSEFFPKEKQKGGLSPQINNENSKERHSERSKFKVGFYGGFIPLQGVMNILQAAHLLRNHNEIEFELIGTGFEYEKARAFVKNEGLDHVKFPGWVSTKELRERLWKFDIALGIFGETEKAQLVIPNKVYHYAACRLPIVTKSTPAIHELFEHENNIFEVDGSPQAIAGAILLLQSQPDLRLKIATAAYEKVHIHYNETKVAERLIEFYRLAQRSP